MIKHPFSKICSVVLVLALLMGMLPVQVWAQESKDIASANLSAAATEGYIASGGDFVDVLIGSVAGAAGGVLAASGADVVVQAVVGAGISMASNEVIDL